MPKMKLQIASNSNTKFANFQKMCRQLEKYTIFKFIFITQNAFKMSFFFSKQRKLLTKSAARGQPKKINKERAWTFYGTAFAKIK